MEEDFQQIAIPAGVRNQEKGPKKIKKWGNQIGLGGTGQKIRRRRL